MIVLVALLAYLLSAVGTTSGAETASAPTLTAEPGSALVVRGSNFRDGERVTLTIVTGARPGTVHVRAVRGSFRVNLRVPAVGCGAPRFVRARGDQGSVAVVGMAKPGICVPPPRR